MIFGDPDIIRRVRAQSPNGKVRLCAGVQGMCDDARDACEQLASDSHAYIASLAKRYGEGDLQYLDDEDIVQETMAKVLRDSSQFRGETVESWKAWLAAVRNHTILDIRRFQLRHRRHSEETPGVNYGILEDGLVHTPDEMQRTPDAVASIREEYQMVLAIAEAYLQGSKKLLEDHFRFGLDGESLANRHACAPYAARRRLRRIMRYLREVLPPQRERERERPNRLRVRVSFLPCRRHGSCRSSSPGIVRYSPAPSLTAAARNLRRMRRWLTNYQSSRSAWRK